MIVRVRNYPVSSMMRSFFGPRFPYDLLPGTEQGSTSEVIGGIPSVDLAEYDDRSVLVAVVPGAGKDQLNISFKEGVVTIRGERKNMEVPENGRLIRAEIEHGTFVRSVQVPHSVDIDRITAELKDGILKVTLPKSEEARPKTITIQ